MDGIIGRLQTEADLDGKRTDVQLETSVNAIKDYNNTPVKDIIEGMGLGVSISSEKPDHSSIWMIFT